MSVTPPPPEQSPSSAPAVKMKMRPDLTFDRQTYQGVEYWVIKEPLGQKYFQFPPHVFFLLRQLDGTKTIDQLQDIYHREYAPKRITRADLQQLLQRFHRDGLVISDVTGQGTELLKRGRKNKTMERLAACTNVLAIRYRGFDPERILNWLIKWTWWLFTPTAVVIALFFGIVAVLSVVVNWHEFQARLPGFDQFFDIRRWYMFVGVLAVTKILHEFGHGLSCKRLGGECHEIGFMLLVLTPCLYCNVSDSWRLPNKWHRAAIGAAGMYVEFILATIATFVWWFAQPGWLLDICLQVMLISSVSTLLFNGNPLLRFDGYYILSDILEIPNLQQKSSKALNTLLGRHWLGLEIPDDQLMPTNRPWAFASFTVAAFCYRWFILFSIIVFLTRWLEPYGLESIGIGIAMFAVAGLLGWPLYRLYRYMSVPGRMHQIKKTRFSIGTLLFVGIIATILLIPIPHYLRCSLIVMPREIETIYVKETGLLISCEVSAGEQVGAGQTLAKLENLDLELMYRRAAGELQLKKNQRQIAMVGGTSGRSPEYIEMIDTVESEIEQLTKVVAELEKRIERLTLKSSIAGSVLATPYQHPSQGGMHEIPLVESHPLLTGRNEYVSAVRGQRFCEVADLSQWQAIVLLDEQQIKFAHENQNVRIKLDVEPHRVIDATVQSLGVSDQSMSKQQREQGQEDLNAEKGRLPDLVTEMVAAHKQAEIQYFARVPIEEGETKLKLGLSGQARLFTGYRSLGARLMWWINHNFRS